MTVLNVTVSVKVSWWVRPLLSVLGWLHRRTGLQVDVAALAGFLTRYGVRSSVR
ncbi:hypothetical protein C7416_102207 [Cupriavidus phytorum]|uniref:Uncharacterized protein n=1 Tax=Cupriavidus phytorum TaxID=3024399 RepID=A0A2W7PIN3_9BURK|nr:hypothetical protein [Cupriavidus alkaliphilus]PZX32047.1 hypothetical protein C7416_102207 [Cupriavidus alkaliphilus]